MNQEQDLLEELRLRAAALVEAKESDDEEDDEADEDESEDDEKEDKSDAKETNGITKDKMTKESVDEDTSFEIDSIFDGEEVSEEFKIKVTALFESAVAQKVSTLKEAYAKTLADLQGEMSQQNLAESVELNEELVSRVDGYLEYVVEQWMEKNELALERGIKSDLFESFMTGMQGLFEEHMINVPEDKIEVLESQATKIEELQEQVDSIISENVNLKQELKQVAKREQISEAAYGLSDAEHERFMSLAEEISYESSEVFGKKLQVIRDRMFSHVESSKQITESFTNEEELLEEVVVTPSKRDRVDESISALAAQISRQ